MKKRSWLAVVLAAIVLIAVVVTAVIVLGNRKDKDGDSQESSQPDRVGSVLTGEGAMEVEDDQYDDWLAANDTGQDAYIVNMADSTWHFEDGDSPSYDMSVVNDTGNSQAVYLELVTVQDQKVLFVSDFLEPGDAIHGVKLGEVLEKGEYDCYLTYHLMDQEKEQETGTVTIAVTVVVEN